MAARSGRAAGAGAARRLECVEDGYNRLARYASVFAAVLRTACLLVCLRPLALSFSSLSTIRRNCAAGTRGRTSESQRPPSSSACVKAGRRAPQPLQSTWSASRPRDASDARLCEDCAAGRPAAL